MRFYLVFNLEARKLSDYGFLCRTLWWYNLHPSFSHNSPSFVLQSLGKWGPSRQWKQSLYFLMIVDFWLNDNFLNFGHSGIRCACLQQEQCPSLNWLAAGVGLDWPVLFPMDFSLDFSSVLPWFAFCTPWVRNLCPVLVFVKNQQSEEISWRLCRLVIEIITVFQKSVFLIYLLVFYCVIVDEEENERYQRIIKDRKILEKVLCNIVYYRIQNASIIFTLKKIYRYRGKKSKRKKKNVEAKGKPIPIYEKNYPLSKKRYLLLKSKCRKNKLELFLCKRSLRLKNLKFFNIIDSIISFKSPLTKIKILKKINRSLTQTCRMYNQMSCVININFSSINKNIILRSNKCIRSKVI